MCLLVEPPAVQPGCQRLSLLSLPRRRRRRTCVILRCAVLCAAATVREGQMYGQQEHRNYNHHYHLLHLHLHLHHWQQTTTTMTTPRGCHAPWRGRRRVDMPNAMRLFWSWGNRCRKHHAARRVDRLIHALDQQFLLAWKDTRLIDLSRRGSHSATTAYAAA